MMRLALMGVVTAGVLAVGCAGPEEATNEGAGAASQDTAQAFRITNADYDLAKVIVHDGEVRGAYLATSSQSSVCTFAFSGRIDEADDGHDAALVTATDGFQSVRGRLRVVGKAEGDSVGPKLKLELDAVLGACDRMGNGKDFSLTKSKSLAAESTVGWAPVSADKAYFFDAPNGTKRAAFVLKGDIVALERQADGSVVKDGFAKAAFVNAAGKKTTGYLSFADLMAPWTTGE